MLHCIVITETNVHSALQTTGVSSFGIRRVSKNRKFKWLVKVGASKGVTPDLNKSWPGGFRATRKPPGYTTADRMEETETKLVINRIYKIYCDPLCSCHPVFPHVIVYPVVTLCFN